MRCGQNDLIVPKRKQDQSFHDCARLNKASVMIQLLQMARICETFHFSFETLKKLEELIKNDSYLPT